MSGKRGQGSGPETPSPEVFQQLVVFPPGIPQNHDIVGHIIQKLKNLTL
jgi:hypothetical protein